MDYRSPSRRTLLAAGIVGAAAGVARAAPALSQTTANLRVRDDAPGAPISLLVYGSNEIGVMDGGPKSAALDRHAGVTARRFGGDLTTTYNWTNNACNAGKRHNNSNGAFLLDALQIPPGERKRPGIVVETMHEASLAMGARSLVTLPLSPYVAADFDGPVATPDAAPSRRFVPTRWTLGAKSRDPVDLSICDAPHFIERLTDRYGAADSSRGVFAYALDNEPALWTQNHPTVAPARMPIDAFLARSIAAARAIKTVDPSAKIFGPSSWGATGMVDFQNAPDWSAHKGYGNFLALYLDAFKRASEHDGKRLLDALDVHWYPFSKKGALFRTDDPALDQARLDAPRSLTEAGFVEDSWVARALAHAGDGSLGLPILPSLHRMIARWFPGTALSVSEFNYGLGKRVPSALALADALGRFGATGVYFASHWGSLADGLGEAYRLFRERDVDGGAFSGQVLPVEQRAVDGVSAFAAIDGSAARLVLINRTMERKQFELGFTGGRKRKFRGALGFDAEQFITGERADPTIEFDGGWRCALPPLSARRYLFA